MKSLVEKLHVHLATVCPIDGVSIGRAEDRSSWSIKYSEDATDEQRVLADRALKDFDPSAPEIEDIKAEAQRRIITITGGSDLQSSMIRQMNWMMEGGTKWLEISNAIKVIRERSNLLEASLPVDYTDDKHWI